MSKTLIIVESPHKAKVISGFLDSSYIVKASVGHIREIPAPKAMTKTEKEKYTDYGIDVNSPNFETLYKVEAGKSKVVSDLRAALRQCDTVVISTDPDREGEAIGWHLLDLLSTDIKKAGAKVKRATWTEITKKAVMEGLKNTRSIDMNMVDSAVARSLYDRLFGYSISPVLWKTVARGTSGGRVQSPALRLIVDRERERLSFVKAEYLAITGFFEVGDKKSALNAKLTTFGGKKISTGGSFGSDGKLTDNSLTLTEERWSKLQPILEGFSYSVSDVSTKPYSRKAPLPYTTSSFQQDVGNRLRLSSKQSMAIAQKIYEQGLLTYMRTDSTEMGPEGLKAARDAAISLFGKSSVPSSYNIHKAKKSAQGGHEALRPTVDASGHFIPPKALKGKLDTIDKNAYKVYECVYNRAVASQMNPAVGVTTTVTISSTDSPANRTAKFTTSATVFTELGWTALTKIIDDDAESNTLDSKVEEGDLALLKTLTPTTHSTTPPPRYTEPKLVQVLEEKGLGRPSSYATIVTVNQTRGYVKKNGQQLYPSWLGMKVAKYLESNIPNFVAYDATAQMEEELDKIEDGSLKRDLFLKKEWGKIVNEVLPLSSNIDWKAVDADSTIALNNGYQIKVNSFGSWLEKVSDPLDENGRRPGVRLSDDEDLGHLDFTLEEVCEKIYEASKNRVQDKVLGVLTDGVYAGWTVTAKDGKFGPYAQATPPEGSPKSLKPVNQGLGEDADLNAVTLETVSPLFAEVKLPRTLSENIFVGQGARGPWIGWKASAKSRRATFYSMPEGYDPRTITKEEAQAVVEEKLAAKKDKPSSTAKKAAAKKAAPAKKVAVKRATPRKAAPSKQD